MLLRPIEKNKENKREREEKKDTHTPQSTAVIHYFKPELGGFCSLDMQGVKSMTKYY